MSMLRPAAEIPFQADGHRITIQLNLDAEWYCRLGFAHSEIQRLTGVHRPVIKDIDKQRLERLYMDGDDLLKPENQAQYN